MRLSLVYGLATRDTSYLEIFYPSRRLKEAARSQGHEIDLRLAFEVDEDLEAFARLAREGPVLVRGEVPDGLRERLEGAGLSCVNGLRAHRLARDKLASYRLAGARGLPYPELYAYEEGGAIGPEALSSFLPFVAKPRYGKMGRGVVLVDGPVELESFAATREAGVDYLYQRPLMSSRGRDKRLIVMGGKLFATVERRSEGFVSNVHGGGETILSSVDGKTAKEALGLCLAAGLFYGAVDFLFEDDGSLSFCEINDYPGFEGLEKATGLDFAGALVASLATAWVEGRLERR